MRAGEPSHGSLRVAAAARPQQLLGRARVRELRGGCSPPPSRATRRPPERLPQAALRAHRWSMVPAGDENVVFCHQLASTSDLPQRSKLGFVYWARKSAVAGWWITTRHVMAAGLDCGFGACEKCTVGTTCQILRSCWALAAGPLGPAQFRSSCGADGPHSGSLPGSGLPAPVWVAASPAATCREPCFARMAISPDGC